jgi:hypothetical protein
MLNNIVIPRVIWKLQWLLSLSFVSFLQDRCISMHNLWIISTPKNYEVEKKNPLVLSPAPPRVRPPARLARPLCAAASTIPSLPLRTRIHHSAAANPLTLASPPNTPTQFPSPRRRHPPPVPPPLFSRVLPLTLHHHHTASPLRFFPMFLTLNPISRRRLPHRPLSCTVRVRHDALPPATPLGVFRPRLETAITLPSPQPPAVSSPPPCNPISRHPFPLLPCSLSWTGGGGCEVVRAQSRSPLAGGGVRGRRWSCGAL